MSKTVQLALGLVSLAVIVVLGWAFFRVNMAVHPLMRACFHAMVPLHPGMRSIALRSGLFEVDGQGCRVVLNCDLKDQEGRESEGQYFFTLEQDPALPPARVGGNPFEDPSLVITAMESAGKGPQALDTPIHAAPTPALIHVPLGTVERMAEGRPVGPATSTFYDRRLRFFRYTDTGAKAD